MKKKTLRMTLVAGLLLVSASTVNAAVTYSLTGNDGLQAAAFTLNADQYIRPLTAFPYPLEPYPDAYRAMGEVFSASSAGCIASSTYRPYSCTNVLFALDVRYRDFPARRNDVIAISFSDGGAGFIYFDAGAFSTPGRYTSSSGYLTAVLTVTNTLPVPEAGTWAMMVLGFGGIGFAMRRKKATTRIRFA